MRRRKHHLPSEVFSGSTYVIALTFCTAGRRPWLRRPELARIVGEEVLRLDCDAIRVVGYCLMPDHAHLVTAASGVTPGRVVQLAKGRSARAVRAFEPGLEVWQRGYHDHVIRRREGLYATLQYIFLNPVRQALVESWWDYPWLGSPLLGPLGPETWTGAPPENVAWSELLGREPPRL